LIKRALHILRRFLPLLFSLAVLVYLFAFRSPLDENLKIAAGIDTRLMVLAAALGIVSFAFGALRLKVLVGVLGHRLSIWRALTYTLVGHFYNSAIPGGAVGGDAIKALYLSQATGSKPQAFAAVLVDRLCGLFMLAALALIALLPNIHEPDMRQAAVVIVVFAGGATLAIGAMTSRRIRRLIPSGTSARLPFRDVIRAFDEAMQVYRGHKRGLIAALLLSALPQAGWIGMHIAIGHGLGIPVTWIDYAVVVPVAGMVAALPISFGGWGVGEAATAHFLALYGETAAAGKALYSQGAILSAIGRLIQLLWALAGIPASWALPKPREIKRAVEMEPVLENGKEQE
jgi:hypothetical protein